MFAQLERLDLSSCPRLTAAWIGVLDAMPQLRELELQAHPWLDDDALEVIARREHLEVLHVGSFLEKYDLPSGEGAAGDPTQITHEGVAKLARLSKLRKLDLSAAPPLPVAALRELAELPFDELMLAWTTVEYDDETADLGALKRLWPEAEVEWYKPWK